MDEALETNAKIHAGGTLVVPWFCEPFLQQTLQEQDTLEVILDSSFVKEDKPVKTQNDHPTRNGNGNGEVQHLTVVGFEL